MNTRKFRAKLAETGLTQAEFAQTVGISKNTVTAKLKGRSHIYADEVKKWCEVLRVTDPAEMYSIFFE